MSAILPPITQKKPTLNKKIGYAVPTKQPHLLTQQHNNNVVVVDVSPQNIKSNKGLAGLTDLDIAKHRHTHLHNTSVSLLEEGYVNSFLEIFELVEQQKYQREILGRDSGHYYDPLLPDEPQKLETLARHLSQAEKLERENKLTDVCNTLEQLSVQCKSSGDVWLADHFYSKSLIVSEHVEGDEGRKLADSHKNLGLMYEEQLEMTKAIQQLEAYFIHSQKHISDWYMEDGTSIFNDACEHLQRAYANYAITLRQTDPSLSIEFFQKAYDVIKRSSHIEKQAIACYQLGLAFENSGDYKTALKHLKSYYERTKHNNDDLGYVNSCEAISHTYEEMEQLTKAADYQKKILAITEHQVELQDKYSLACATLGDIYNRLGMYDESVSLFNQASISNNTTTVAFLPNVQFGIANGHKMLDEYFDNVLSVDVTAQMNIIKFKDSHESQCVMETQETEIQETGDELVESFILV